MNELAAFSGAFDRYTNSIIEYVRNRVDQALALERDRTDAELAELRDEINALAARPVNEQVSEELRSLNNRVARLTQTVAELMGGAPAAESLRVPTVADIRRGAHPSDPRKPW